MSYDPETRPSVGKDVGQDPRSNHPPPAPENMRPSSNLVPSDTPNPDPGYPDQATMNRTIARLLALPDPMVVYPGHGATTTIGQERRWMTQLAANAR